MYIYIYTHMIFNSPQKHGLVSLVGDALTYLRPCVGCLILGGYLPGSYTKKWTLSQASAFCNVSTTNSACACMCFILTKLRRISTICTKSQQRPHFDMLSLLASLSNMELWTNDPMASPWHPKPSQQNIGFLIEFQWVFMWLRKLV